MTNPQVVKDADAQDGGNHYKRDGAQDAPSCNPPSPGAAVFGWPCRVDLKALRLVLDGCIQRNGSLSVPGFGTSLSVAHCPRSVGCPIPRHAGAAPRRDSRGDRSGYLNRRSAVPAEVPAFLDLLATSAAVLHDSSLRYRAFPRQAKSSSCGRRRRIPRAASNQWRTRQAFVTIWIGQGERRALADYIELRSGRSARL